LTAKLLESHLVLSLSKTEVRRSKGTSLHGSFLDRSTKRKQVPLALTLRAFDCCFADS
jgi:hypothetical protein